MKTVVRSPLRALCAGLVLAFTAQAPLAQAAATVPEAPALKLKAYALMDYDSGEIIAASNPDLRVAPASITKVLTSYVVFDEIRHGRMKETDPVLISEKAWRQGIDSTESRMFIDVGSQIPLIDLLRGIIVQSGNDASLALAEHVAGSESAFAELMNQHAKRLGMTNSHFTDATGMPHPDHYTTARDLTIMSRALIREFPEQYKMFAEREFTWNKIRQPNRNLLLGRDPSVDGIKTGHTSEAGYCLLTSAQRDGRRLIAAVMGADSWAYREQASLELLNWGFRFFETASLLGADKPVESPRVYKGAAETVAVGTLEPVALALPRGSKDKLQLSHQLNTPLVAPLAKGQELGTATITIDGKVLKTVPLVALNDVEAGGFFHRLFDTIRLWIARLLG